jgi:catechol 2,3-dioxygenase-like lactoylglutathione lyase family enzyme
VGTVLDLLVLRTSDVEAARRFYEALGLRFQEERHGLGPRHFSSRLGATVLEVDRAAAVASVAQYRATRCAALSGEASAVERARAGALHGGRLLVYFPDADLADGAAEAESGGPRRSVCLVQRI